MMGEDINFRKIPEKQKAKLQEQDQLVLGFHSHIFYSVFITKQTNLSHLLARKITSKIWNSSIPSLNGDFDDRIKGAAMILLFLLFPVSLVDMQKLFYQCSAARMAPAEQKRHSISIPTSRQSQVEVTYRGSYPLSQSYFRSTQLLRAALLAVFLVRQRTEALWWSDLQSLED